MNAEYMGEEPMAEGAGQVQECTQPVRVRQPWPARGEHKRRWKASAMTWTLDSGHVDLPTYGQLRM